MKFNVWDKVVLKKGVRHPHWRVYEDTVYTLTSRGFSDNCWLLREVPGEMHEDFIELYQPKITKNTMSTLSEKFVLAFKKEPERSFRKAGITNGDDILTDEGQKIFMTWMLNNNAVEFKKDVVDGILAELAEEKK